MLNACVTALWKMIQTELDRIVQHWNLHEIRSQRHSDIPSGKHGLLYYVPEIFGGRDYGHHVDLDNLEICLDLNSSPEKMYSEDINIKGQGLLTMPMSYKATYCKKSKHPFEEKKNF